MTCVDQLNPCKDSNLAAFRGHWECARELCCYDYSVSFTVIMDYLKSEKPDEETIMHFLMNNCDVFNCTFVELVRLKFYTSAKWIIDNKFTSKISKNDSIYHKKVKKDKTSSRYDLTLDKSPIICARIALFDLEFAKELFYNHNFPLNHQALSFAVSEGNLEILKWLISEKCPSRLAYMTEAAKNGYLECLKVLREYNKELFHKNKLYLHENAKENNHENIMKWLIDISM